MKKLILLFVIAGMGMGMGIGNGFAKECKVKLKDDKYKVKGSDCPQLLRQFMNVYEQGYMQNEGKLIPQQGFEGQEGVSPVDQGKGETEQTGQMDQVDQVDQNYKLKIKD